MNSQTAVNGVRSDDKVHRRGPKNGYAYLEFFVSPENLNELVSRIEEEPQITYYAVSQSIHKADILGRKTSTAAQTESEAAKTPPFQRALDDSSYHKTDLILLHYCWTWAL
ncbi:hypothetical protein BGX30_004976 [Mortierella sp. GBA39]|nr:hypothetical protein BGX30_004976 [Mortierella sp. GBA39]